MNVSGGRLTGGYGGLSTPTYGVGTYYRRKEILGKEVQIAHPTSISQTKSINENIFVHLRSVVYIHDFHTYVPDLRYVGTYLGTYGCVAVFIVDICT